MKVLISAYACEPHKGSEPGVGWNWAVNLSQYCEVTVLTRANNREALEKEVIALGTKNLHFIYYDLPFLLPFKKRIIFGTALYYILWQLNIARFLRRNNLDKTFDVIHQLTLNTFQVPALLYKFTSHSVWGPIGGGITAPLFAFFRLGTFYGIMESLRSFLTYAGRLRPAVRKALRGYSTVIYANSDTAQFLAGTNRSKLVHLETGVSLEQIGSGARSCALVDAPRIRLLFVGSLVARKGLHLLLEALTRLENNYCLTVVGNGPLENKLKHIVQKTGLNGRVTFSGFISHRDLTHVYAKHDLFIFPSLRDTSGNVVLEAMASGLPVIAFDLHGMKDVINSKSGMKIAVHSYSQMVDDLYGAIVKLANDETLRTTYSANAALMLRKRFLWETKAEWMYNLYKTTLNAHPAGS